MKNKEFVENYIKAFLAENAKVNLISKNDEKCKIRISIKDNGIGMSKDKLEEILAGLNNIDLHKYGLYNVNERIRLHFGQAYGLSIESIYEEGTTVFVSLPCVTEMVGIKNSTVIVK